MHSFLDDLVTSVVGLAAIATGLAVLFLWCAFEIVRGKASEGWPHVLGTLLLVSLTKYRGGHLTLYRPDVMYSYKVGEDEYLGERFQFGLFFLTGGSERWAEAKISGLAFGSTVDVYYNPRSPSVSTLRQGTTLKAYLWAAFAALMLTWGLRQLVAKLS